MSKLPMDSLSRYLNPIRRLGKRDYSILFPLCVSIVITIVSEVVALHVFKDPNIVGTYIIWVNVTTIMYFAFRDGVKGGLVAAGIPILYYAYIIDSRNYTGQQMTAAIETTIVLAVLYFLMASIIGWLKQTIDALIESESNARRRLETIVQQLPVGVTITDSKGKVVLVNKKVDAILGTKIPIGFQIGSPPILPTTINGRTYSPSQGPLAQVLFDGKSTAAKEFTITRKDGKVIQLQSSASVVRNTAGKVIAAAAITIDLTQQKELEKRKNDFVNMASHELKTPLTSMKLYIDTLAARIENSQDSRAMKIIERIKLQTDRLQDLVNDLLDVSKIQTGKLTFTKESFRIDSLISQTIEDMQAIAKNQEIVFTSKLHVRVFADKFRIYQVITNLLTNAIKYSHEGKQIKVNLKRDNGRVIISVRDAGIGIAKQQQKKIFERLYQVVDEHGKTYPGFGMGLYISKEIVTRHRGTIWVESDLGKGSTFYVSLPISKSS